MRTVVLAITAIVISCLPVVNASASDQVACSYDQSYSCGLLTISGGGGLSYSVTDQYGQVRAAGVVTSDMFTTSISDVAPGSLGVRVGGQYFVVNDRDYGWE